MQKRTRRFGLTPIGYVNRRSDIEDIKNRDLISEIIISPDLVEALDGIEEFSHLYIIFWMHKISNTEKKMLKVHPRGRSDMPLRGVFATRTPRRPNSIGLTLVQLLNVNKNVLTIRGLDAFHGTPVLDIKPFDSWDLTEDYKVPKWLVKLEEERKV
ncbi:MAG: tRNA (N6-threonylcarbamoyladenosine(37)-N6)-methyltransferase TrmO [Candidatus Bathyarchaeota archaeon]|nr:MAG: tRNA (N6-threonylcarbamoyladenosine(37)-N6)-methyltransferase TrmO [Candidatus Bathyarchaeota archaeon]